MISVYDSTEAIIRSLKNLGIESVQYGSLLVPVMLSKPPNDSQLPISTKFDKNLWDFNAFLGAFRGELEARERCLAISIASQEPVNARKPVSSKQETCPANCAALMSSQNAATCTFSKGH